MSVQGGIVKRRVHIPNELELELSKQLSNGCREQAVHYIQNLLERHRKENVSIEDDLLVCNSVNGFVLRYAAFHTFSPGELLIEIDPSAPFYSGERLDEIVLSNLERAFDLLKKPEEEKT